MGEFRQAHPQIFAKETPATYNGRAAEIGIEVVANDAEAYPGREAGALARG